LIYKGHWEAGCTDAADEMKKHSRKRKHCALAVVRRSQNFSPHRRPLPGGVGWPKFNQLEMVTTFTHKPSLVRIRSMHAILRYRGNRSTHTHKHAHPPADRTDYNTLHCS